MRKGFDLRFMVKNSPNFVIRILGWSKVIEFVVIRIIKLLIVDSCVY